MRDDPMVALCSSDFQLEREHHCDRVVEHPAEGGVAGGACVILSRGRGDDKERPAPCAGTESGTWPRLVSSVGPLQTEDAALRHCGCCQAP